MFSRFTGKKGMTITYLNFIYLRKNGAVTSSQVIGAMKNFILFVLLTVSFDAFTQRVIEENSGAAELMVNVVDISRNREMDTFTVSISSELNQFEFFTEGKYVQRFVLDFSALYKVTVSAKGYSLSYYEWEYCKEKRNIRILHVHLYPEGYSEKEKNKALKKYYRQQNKEGKNEPEKTCRGLRWEYEYTI